MHITIISSSMRANSQSLKVALWLKDHAIRLGVESSVLDLHELRLPLYDNGETNAENAASILEQLKNADGVVFVSPEWNGMMSHGLVNMLQYVADELAHKPVMLAGVSAGRGGSYPLIQMRTMGYKNNHFVASPENLLVQNCKSVLNDHDMSDDASDISIKKRADYGLKVLLEYAQALQNVRQSGVLDRENFKNGV